MKVATLLENGPDGLRSALQALDAIADAFEVRLDAWAGCVEPAAIRAATRKPLIATLRRTDEGGLFGGAPADGLAVLRACASAGFEFVDVAGQTPVGVPESQVVRSVHAPATPPSGDIVEAGRALAARGAVFKFASAIHSFEDILTLLAAARQLGREGVPFTMMGLGEFPRALMHLWGSRWVYGGGRTCAPGQPPLSSVERTLRHWNDPQPGQDLFLVVGDPVEASLSPRMHNAAFRATGISGAYGALRVPDEPSLARLLDRGSALGLSGISVTMPLKEAAYRHVSDLTPEARAAGAVNCVRFSSGKAQGHNTDGPGAAQVVGRLLPSKGADVLILGTGGVARSIAGHLPDHCVQLTGRRPARLATLRAFLEVETVPWKDAAMALDDFDLLINATAAQEPVPLNGYRGALFDLHYDEHPTVWERLASERALTFAGGRDLLLEQGVFAFEFWTGKPAPAEVMRRALGVST